MARPVLLCLGLLFCCYAVIGSIPLEFHTVYDFNDIQISLIYLPLGFGAMISAVTAGKLIDWNLKRHMLKVGLPIVKGCENISTEAPIERARLQVCLPFALILAGSLVLYGLLTAGRVPIAVLCTLLTLIGGSLFAIGTCMNVLVFDLCPGKPAAATAANNLVRCWLSVGASAAIVPLVTSMGYGGAMSLVAGVSLLPMPICIVIMKCGPRWRCEQASISSTRTPNSQR
jgi:hypothetical protein